MNLNYLRYFRVLAKMEHYTKAADELAITQPSLSHAMSTLEKELGTYLFEKDHLHIEDTYKANENKQLHKDKHV